MSDVDSNYDEDEAGPYLGVYNGERNEEGERHGDGKATLPNGDNYEGSYEHGLRHGYGVYKFASTGTGARYLGEYHRGKRNGKGTMYYPDGSVYKGQWADNQRNGQGVYTYANGDIYEGIWVNNLRHGQGTYTYSSDSHKGTVFEGTWTNAKADGAGHLKHGDSHKYQGSWSDDVMQGPGKFVFNFGAEQHGEYIPVEQDVEGMDESEEGRSHNIISRWRAHKITSITADEAVSGES
jgi:radial spoke head protein 1